MTHSESTGKIAAALAKAQATVEGASKDSKNPHFNSRYADLASIVDACKKPLAENEIAVIQSPSADANLIRMTTLLLHSSGEWIESDPLQVQARDAFPQAVGSCLTYLRRYQLAAMVGVAPDDDDAEAAEGRTTGTVQRATQMPPKHRPAASGVAPAASDARAEGPNHGVDLPDGARLVKGVLPGRAGAEAEIVFTSGETYLTWKKPVVAEARQFCANQTPVFLDVKASATGNKRIEGLMPVPANYDPPKGLPQKPVDEGSIPF